MKRSYTQLLDEHLRDNRQMAFVSGPRQVGKTTLARGYVQDDAYLNWDRSADRLLITAGADAVAKRLQLDTPTEARECVVFDEIHRYPRWKGFLKGFFDAYEGMCRVVVTGSARLDVYKRGGDSLMGRYFPYRLHPLSVGEVAGETAELTALLRPVSTTSGADEALKQLLAYGGFPEPFLRADPRFLRRWGRLRSEQLFKEDLRDLTRIQDVGSVEVLSQHLVAQVGELLNYSSLAVRIGVSVDTIKAWIATLESMYFCYRIRPWYRNVAASLRKQPKLFLWDWSSVTDRGARHENIVASHLLKAVHWWTDLGLGTFDLFFLRDKAKREVDFLVSRDGEPWFLVEAKSSSKRDLSPALKHFADQLGVKTALQVTFDLEPQGVDVFACGRPVRVPVADLLSRLP